MPENIRYRIQDNNGEIFFCNLKTSDEEKIKTINSENVKLDKLRAGKLSNSDFTVYTFTNDKDLLLSSQKFKTLSKTLINTTLHIKKICNKIEDDKKKNNRRLIHNLTSINAHCIQEVYAIIDQSDISGNIEEQIKKVRKKVTEEPKTTARALIRIAKYNAAMKNEFSVFKKIYSSSSEIDLKIRNHVVHKVFLNVLHLYFADFSDKLVEVVVFPSISEALFDYETMHVAIYHLIENAAKYTKDKSAFLIQIKEVADKIHITLSMTSLFVEKDEELKIFSEDFSGKEAKDSGLSGDGLGLSLVKRIIELNNGSIFFSRASEEFVVQDERKYQVNEFHISLLKA